MTAKVTYTIGKSGSKYYFLEYDDGSGMSMGEATYEAIKHAFNNPILTHDFSNKQL